MIDLRKARMPLLACSGMMALVMGAPAALAQDAAADGAAASGDAGLADIIVTATKRAENIQNVPLSISAVTSDSLRNGNVSDFSRLDVLIPGVKFGQSGNDARPAIRGTRTQQVIGNADPLVAFYNDGIYRSRPGQALAIFLDTERVEVARGPQGTLFGRNSFGGAVNVISKAPKLGVTDFGASLQVTNFSGVKGEGFVNLPLGDHVAIRLSGYASKRDGWVKNDANTNNDLHDDDNQVVRGQIKFEQAGFSNTLRVEYWHGGGNGPGDFGYYTPGVPINPATGATNGVNGVINPILNVGGYGGLAPNTRGSRDWRHISTNYAFDRDVNQITVSNDTTVDVGFADLRSILSYTHYKEYRQGDPDYSAQVLDAAYNRVKTRTTTQEIQLVSKPGGPLSWVVGFYGLQDRPSDLYFFGNDQNGAVNPATGKPFYRNISGNPADNRAGNLYIQGPFRSYTNSIAFYGDATYSIAEGIRVLGGIRWTQDKRKASIDNVPFAGPPGSTDRDRKTFEKVTWRAGAQFDVGPRSMLYGTYSTGFLAGGFSGSPSFDASLSSLSSFDPQTVKAAEVGSKNVLFDGKLRANISAYYNRYSNLVTQKLIFNPNNNAVSSITVNAGKIKSYGLEGEFDYYPSDAAYLGLRMAWTHARFGDYTSANAFAEGSNDIITDPVTGVTKTQFQLRGFQVPLNPNFTATVVGSYNIDAGSTGTFTPGVTVFASTRYRTSDQPYFFANQKGYATVDAFLNWKASGDDKLRAQLFVNNLTNKKILLRTTPNAGKVIYQDFAAPRIFGARISYNY
jgi:iron complex outermembrane receptor protein